MTDFDVTTGHALAVKLWAEKAEMEALKQTHVYQFMGDDPGSLVYTKNELNASAGDRIRCSLIVNLTGTGVVEDATLEGNEEDLVPFTDDVLILDNRNAVRTNGKMTEQRMLLDFVSTAQPVLSKWLANLMDTSFMNQLAGISTASLQLIGNNTGVAPAATRLFVATGGAAVSEGTISASPTGMSFTLPMIDELVMEAQTAGVAIEPIDTPNGPKYVLFMHPRVARQMKTRVAANTINWFDYSRAHIEGGDTSENWLKNPARGAMGEYNNVLIHVNSRLPLSPGQTTTRRSVFCGRQAALAAFGQGHDKNRVNFVIKTFDYENKTGVAVEMIYGLKRAIYNSLDYGTLVLATGGVA